MQQEKNILLFLFEFISTGDSTETLNIFTVHSKNYTLVQKVGNITNLPLLRDKIYIIGHARAAKLKDPREIDNRIKKNFLQRSIFLK